MISRLKNRAGPTSDAASISTSTRGLPGSDLSRCLWAFSIITMAASIMAPMAMAIPPRLMMLAPIPSARMAVKAIRRPTGSMIIATNDDRTCSRNTKVTRATTILSSSRVVRRVSMADRIRSDRS